MLFFLASYPLLGAGIKYIDDAFDEKTFNKKLAFIITPFLSILGAYAMFVDPVSATILLSVLAGVCLKGKVDNLAFIGGLLICLVIVLTLGIEFLVIPLILLSAAAVLDEVGNDLIDKKKEYFKQGNAFHKFIMYFFGQRWIMKTAILYLVIVNIVPVYFFFAMILFDYAYVFVDFISKIKQGIIKIDTLTPTIAKFACLFK